MITYRAGSVTDVRIGDTPITAVYVGAVKVFPPSTPGWLAAYIDSYHHYDPAVNDVELSNGGYGTPTKGSLLFFMYLQSGMATVALAIYDGTRWVEDAMSKSDAYSKDLDGSNTWAKGMWFNSPTVANRNPEFDAWLADPDGGATGSCTMSAYGTPAGINIVITDKNGQNPLTVTAHYPPGVTQDDLPVSQSFL